MTISSSMNAGVMGLTANANKLGVISDNIANSSTYGYKRAHADFNSMVVSGGGGTYSAGGVSFSSSRSIADRGSLIPTSNSTDLAIAGRGMLPVTTSAAVGAGGDTPMMLTTTGSFSADAEGYLRTDSGLVLMGWPANPDGTIPNYPRDTATALEPIRVNLNEMAGRPTTTMEFGVNLPATSTKFGATPANETVSLEYFDNLGSAENLNVTFVPQPPATAGGPENIWTMQITDSASGGALVAEVAMTFNDDRTTGGTLASVVPTGAATDSYDPATGELNITVDGGPITINIGKPGEAGGFSQLSDTFAPATVEKDGSSVASMSGLEVDEGGLLHAIYDNGETRAMYQIPVADVPNPNGLTALDNQSYQISRESGAFYLWSAGDGPTGSIAGYAREESTSDVAHELTELIRTQRAYSSNAKVIQTVDEMLQETTTIKR
ncbi:flagellar hook protein FlgE [Qingshengfaniella alkalisoli]|uniref:Flagellar hook protein FlgE n=1 Tax=Qingshengfaniella alkalisoli TaxID=2599296 RepID=A0A5B8I829_9RHOB|nr:flagellar hook-basal body complex protein [Qingshengfaniella alkalisoli]QDY70065.1 flagellar hook-basal body complex protein [Qingshengfaniella alkalisoli]